MQRAYSDHHRVAPMAHGVDIISVKSLACKRFLQIADRLKIQAKVITDNDGEGSTPISPLCRSAMPSTSTRSTTIPTKAPNRWKSS